MNSNSCFPSCSSPIYMKNTKTRGIPLYVLLTSGASHKSERSSSSFRHLQVIIKDLFIMHAVLESPYKAITISRVIMSS